MTDDPKRAREVEIAVTVTLRQSSGPLTLFEEDAYGVRWPNNPALLDEAETRLTRSLATIQRLRSLLGHVQSENTTAVHESEATPMA